MLGVTMRTVQHWADAGRLNCWRTEGGHRRIRRDSIERLLDARSSRGGGALPGTVVGAEAPAEALRILVVEDEPDLLRLYRMHLSRWRLKPVVSTAANGYEGLVVLGSLRPHLLIADLHMPQVDGFQMLRLLSAMPQLDGTEIVVVTGLGAQEVAQRGGVPHGIAVLPKPIPFSDLENIASRVAAQNGCRLGEREVTQRASAHSRRSSATGRLAC